VNGFVVGVNYWPSATGMRWWRRFDTVDLAADFRRVRDAGADCVRIFLLWEDFQPSPETVADAQLARLRAVADAARESGLALIPTLFTGHMSGANFIPVWALGAVASARFRTVAGDRVTDRITRNWYTDREISDAQALLARECARVLAGHDALWGWDLGNENSNCCVPPTREDGLRWLDAIASAIRSVDDSCRITVGLHMEDLEEDRRIGPAEAARVSDVLCMHGYPIYCSWSAGPVDAELLAFLASVTRWLGGKDVLFAEFGAPTRDGDPDAEREVARMLLAESEAAKYTELAFAQVHASGAIGGLVWCFADYARAIWREPPFDLAPHERHFGLWRADGSAKPAARVLADWRGRARAAPPEVVWADIDPARFYDAPRDHLVRLYARAREESSLARPVL
jgi:endo-1,4-beta-mannosidase